LKDWIQRRGIKTSGKRKADLVKGYVSVINIIKYYILFCMLVYMLG